MLTSDDKKSCSLRLSLNDESITRTSEESATSFCVRQLLSLTATMVEACLRSMGAAVFSDSPTAGLFVLAATLVNFGFLSWRLWAIVSAVAFANVFAAALELPLSQIRCGTYGSAAYSMAAFLVGVTSTGSAGAYATSSPMLALTLFPSANVLFALLIAVCVPITVVLSFSLGHSSRWPALTLTSHIPCYAALAVWTVTYVGCCCSI
jgi:hypothetical protein